MNRKERRRIKKKFKDQNVMVNPGNKPPDYSKTSFCPHHKLKLENETNPTEKDREKIEKIRLIPGKVENKDGSIDRFRTCQKCHFSVPIIVKNEGAKIEGFTVK